MQLKDIQYLLHKIGDYVIPFEISDEKENSGDPNIRYYGYLSASGAWIIQENNITNGTYRYLAGVDTYAANWAVREGLTYILYSGITIGEP